MYIIGVFCVILVLCTTSALATILHSGFTIAALEIYIALVLFPIQKKLISCTGEYEMDSWYPRVVRHPAFVNDAPPIVSTIPEELKVLALASVISRDHDRNIEVLFLLLLRGVLEHQCSICEYVGCFRHMLTSLVILMLGFNLGATRKYLYKQL